MTFDSQTGVVQPNPLKSVVFGPTDANSAKRPRHLVFHPKLSIAYTSMQRDQAGVGVWKMNPKTGALSPVQNLVSVDSAQGENKVAAADLQITPDGRFLYLSDRDTANKEAPSPMNHIAVFRIDQTTGLLKKVGNVPCESLCRSFAIDSKGRFLFVSGEGDNKLGVYRINQQTGMPTPLHKYDLPGKPSWVLSFELPE